VLVDDQPLLRMGFRMILHSTSDIVVVGEAGDGRQAVNLVATHRPDVVLMDVRMPGVDGVEATRRIVGSGSTSRVLILTTFDLDEYVYGALRAGAVGFLLKGTSPALLVEAVRAARAGDGLISPQVTLRLLRHLTPGATAPPPPAVPLSGRELEVAAAVARGRTNTEIAAELFISLSTVKSHLASIQSKLDVRNRVGIAAWAWGSGLVQPGVD
jgi:DNA-binding NarL/FixJ family response regulator